MLKDMAKTTKKPAKTKQFLPMVRLNTLNAVLAAVFVLQGVAILLLSTGFTAPLTTSFLANDPLASQVAGHAVTVAATRHVGDVSLAWLVAAFLFILALMCALRAYLLRDYYERNLKNRFNPLRFIEYGVGVGVMIVVVALVSGVHDVTSLIMLFVLQVLSGLVWLGMERYDVSERGYGWVAYWLGVAVSIVPWVVLAVYASSTLVYGSGVPTWVYAIYVSIFALLAATAVNLYLQRKQLKWWTDYQLGELVFMGLSLVAASALAWQVFAGTLHP